MGAAGAVSAVGAALALRVIIRAALRAGLAGGGQGREARAAHRGEEQRQDAEPDAKHAGTVAEGKNQSGPVSRVLFPPLSRRAANIRLGPWLPRGLISEQPERSGRAILVPRTAGTRSYWLLLQVGFTVPPESPRARCALTAPFHPYPPLAGRAVCFLWHCPASHLDWPLASTLPSGARTFLPPPVPAVAGVHPGRSGGSPLTTGEGRGSLLVDEPGLTVWVKPPGVALRSWRGGEVPSPRVGAT
jgi:hypothetical protein